MVKPSYQYSHKNTGGREGSGMGAESPRSTVWFTSNTEEFFCNSSSAHGALSVSSNSTFNCDLSQRKSTVKPKPHKPGYRCKQLVWKMQGSAVFTGIDQTGKIQTRKRKQLWKCPYFTEKVIEILPYDWNQNWISLIFVLWFFNLFSFLFRFQL